MSLPSHHAPGVSAALKALTQRRLSIAASGTVSRALVLSQPAGLTSEWTGFSPVVLNTWSYASGSSQSRLFLFFRSIFSLQISDYLNHFHSVLHPPFFSVNLLLQSAGRSLWFLDQTFTSVPVNVLGYLIGPVMLRRPVVSPRANCHVLNLHLSVLDWCSAAVEGGREGRAAHPPSPFCFIDKQTSPENLFIFSGCSLQ